MNGKWIWINRKDEQDVYGEFFDTLEYTGGKAVLKISCDTKYAFYVDDKLVAFGQYADYPWHKVYDEVDISSYLCIGKNNVRIVVWYFGDDFMTYYKGSPRLWYEISDEEKLLCVSDEKTLCCEAEHYLSHRKKKITFQMSYSFHYDTREDVKEKYNAVIVDGPENLILRPIKMLTLEPLKKGVLVKDNIYDLGGENAGFFNIKFKATAGTVLTVSYGEHLTDGRVRRKIKDSDFIVDKDYSIGYRDFSFEIVANGEMTEYMNPFLRLGGRYIELEADGDFTIEHVGINETLYPTDYIPFDAGNALRQKIYDTSVRTLKLNMHEHYEDTPWREQGLYTMDSRNQMISGYYAFKEYVFPRASLELMCLDRREDGLLASCFPSSINLALPAFSLYFFIQMREYIDYSGDVTLAREYEYKLNDVMNTFVKRIRNGLSPNFFGGPWYFNFYEWSEGNDGNLSGTDEESFDLILNCVLSLALQNLETICEKAGLEFKFKGVSENLNKRITEYYYNSDTGFYHGSELGNAFAILCGATTNKQAEFIAEKIAEKKSGLVPVTLSMKAWVYDALLLVDKEKYKDYVLNDIDQNYSYMLSKGATSFWETILGETDFNGAGSLSHGWSAIPIYYYNILLKE